MMGGPGGPGGPPPGMDPENRRMMWERFKEEHPEDAEVIVDMVEKYPELRMIMGMPQGGRPGRGPRGPGGDQMGGRDPEHMDRLRRMQELKQHAMELGDQYSDAKDADKKKIEVELRKTLNDLYDLRLTEMQYRVKKVEDRLVKVKEEMSKYQKDRGGVIDAWFKLLTQPSNEDYKTF